MSDHDHDEDEGECGDYGPVINLTPSYSGEDQRLRLKPLLWAGDKPLPAFANTMVTAAKTALAAALENALGSKATEEAKLAYSGRMYGQEGDAEFPEDFTLEVESSSTDAWAGRVMKATSARTTEAALIEALRAAVATYLQSVGCTESFAWSMEINEYGGG